MTPSAYVLVMYRNGQTVHMPWRVPGSGRPTDENLARHLDANPALHCVDRAAIYRRSDRKVMATFLRSTQPTNDQTRLIERIGAQPGAAMITCEPLPNGDVHIRVYSRGNILQDTTVYRHPTVKEMIYE